MKRSILLIAQEAFMQEALGDILDSVGLHPILTGEAQTGIDEFRAQQNDIEAVVLDVGLFNSDDFSVVDKLIHINPSVRVLVSTSYDERELSRRYTGNIPFPVLYKPYSAQAFVSTLMNVLENGRHTDKIA
ncbi:MAG: response regulator transcription factor [Anaerolineales bacterium]|nr:response regulator transcription factor [Anaerolineales bacterium]MCB9003497.1 response regulator transcription factor [Ardenticatenaceae bacterium]